MGGILSVWLGIGLVRFLRLGVLANLIGEHWRPRPPA